MHGVAAATVTCPAIDGIIKEADEVAGDVADKNVLDAALIAAAQAVEHYEITRYGTLIAWAKELGADDCIPLLEENLEEEKEADENLTKSGRRRHQSRRSLSARSGGARPAGRAPAGIAMSGLVRKEI